MSSGEVRGGQRRWASLDVMAHLLCVFNEVFMSLYHSTGSRKKKKQLKNGLSHHINFGPDAKGFGGF